MHRVLSFTSHVVFREVINSQVDRLDSCTIKRMLGNKAIIDRTQDTDFYKENPCEKKPRAPTGDLHYMMRVYRTQGIMSCLSLNSSHTAYKMYL